MKRINTSGHFYTTNVQTIEMCQRASKIVGGYVMFRNRPCRVDEITLNQNYGGDIRARVDYTVVPWPQEVVAHGS